MVNCKDWKLDASGSPCFYYIRSIGDLPGRCKLATRYVCEEYQRRHGLPIDSLLPVSEIPSGSEKGAPAEPAEPRAAAPRASRPGLERPVRVPGHPGPHLPVLRGHERAQESVKPVEPAWVASAVENGLLTELDTEAGRFRIVPSHPGQSELTYGEAALVVEIARIFPGTKLVSLTRRGDAYEAPDANVPDIFPMGGDK